jgi:hypothetical protein
MLDPGIHFQLVKLSLTSSSTLRRPVSVIVCAVGGLLEVASARMGGGSRPLDLTNKGGQFRRLVALANASGQR